MGLLAASSLLLLGCPNPNTYTTPRTIGSGRFQGSAAIEAWGFYVPNAPAYLPAADRAATFVMPPTLALRLGLGNRWEIGVRASDMSSLGGDVKWNFLKTSRIDLAIDPAFQVYQYTANNTDGTSQTFEFLTCRCWWA